MSYSLLQNAKAAEILSPGEPVINRPNPAAQSLKRFGNMVGNSVAKGLSYVNPIDINRRITQGVMAIPDAMRKYDSKYGKMVRTDLAQPNPNHFFPTPFNNSPSQSSPSKYDGEGQSRYDSNPGTGQSIRDTKHIEDAQVPEMRSDPMRPVNLKKYDYSTGQVFTPEQLDTHQREQRYANDNQPSPYDGKQITPSNWRSPGKRYNDLDKSELLTEDGTATYVNGQQVGVPYFDNTYMKKRYGNEVYQPPTPESIARDKRQRLINSIPAEKRQAYFQQEFENELAVREHALAIQKRNDAIQPDPVKDKFKPRYSDIIDDSFNVTGSRFDGSFNESTGRWKPAGQEPLMLSQEQVQLLAAARKRSISDEDYTDDYMELLESLGLPEYWYEAYPSDEIGED